MTSTELETIEGELVPPEPLSEGKAKVLDKRIRLASVRASDESAKLLDLLEEAAVGNIHIALGKTWGEWFKESVTITPADVNERKTLVRLMSGKRCSQREIAQLAGVNQSTVSRILAESPPDADASPVTIGMDGKTYERKPKEEPKEPTEPKEPLDVEYEEVEEEPELDEEEPEEPRTVNDVIADFSENVDYLMPAVQAFTDQLKDDAELFPKARKRIAKNHLTPLTEMIADLQLVIDALILTEE